MRSNGALEWNDFIGERPTPPPVDDTAIWEVTTREMLIGEIVARITNASVSMLEKINVFTRDLIEEGGDAV